MSDVNDQVQDATPLPLVDIHVTLGANYTPQDAMQMLAAIAAGLNTLVGTALLSQKFSAANPVIQHVMQSAASTETAAGILQQQLQQQSQIVSPFMQPAGGPRRMN